MQGGDSDSMHPSSELMDAFQALGYTQVPPMLTMAELTKVRNAQLLLWHPDKSPPSRKAECTAQTATINNAFEFLKAKIEASQDGEFLPPMGQAGASNPSSRRAYRLKRKRIAFTLPGIMDGELELLDFVKQLEKTVNSMTRRGETMQVEQIALGYEVHKNASDPRFCMHYHGVLELSHATDCDSSKFDPMGASGMKLRMNIDKIESEEHWHNKIRYLSKEGHCYMRLKEGPRLSAPGNKRQKTDDGDWSAVLMEASATAATPEHAVEALRERFGQTWVLQYDKLIAAAVSKSACLHV